MDSILSSNDDTEFVQQASTNIDIDTDKDYVKVAAKDMDSDTTRVHSRMRDMEARKQEIEDEIDIARSQYEREHKELIELIKEDPETYLKDKWKHLPIEVQADKLYFKLQRIRLREQEEERVRRRKQEKIQQRKQSSSTTSSTVQSTTQSTTQSSPQSTTQSTASSTTPSTVQFSAQYTIEDLRKELNPILLEKVTNWYNTSPDKLIVFTTLLLENFAEIADYHDEMTKKMESVTNKLISL